MRSSQRGRAREKLPSCLEPGNRLVLRISSKTTVTKKKILAKRGRKQESSSLFNFVYDNLFLGSFAIRSRNICNASHISTKNLFVEPKRERAAAIVTQSPA